MDAGTTQGTVRRDAADSAGGSPRRRFARHYLEMVAAMFVGMGVLWLPALGALSIAGISIEELRDEAPALDLLGMGLSMTVPMVAWMRFRGHAWRPCGEMAAAMLVPTLGVIGLLGAGLMTDFGALMMLEHVVMLPAMLGVMLLRWDEYSAPHPRSITPAHPPVSPSPARGSRGA